MNPYLEQACRWFGPSSCETASALDYIVMAFAAASAALAVVWLSNRIVVRG